VTGRYSYRTPINRNEPFLLLPYGVGFGAWGLIPPVERISAPLPSGGALPTWSLFERLHLPAAVVAWPSVRSTGAQPARGRVDPSRFAVSGAAQPRVVAALASDLGALGVPATDAAFTAIGVEGFSEAQRALHVFLNELPARGTVKGDVVRTYVQELDRTLAELVRRHPRHLIVICSPSAVVPPPLPANAWALAVDRLNREDPGADDGFVLVTGPGTTHRENPGLAHVVDVVPTVLFAAGLPVGRDMDGRVLTDAFTDEFLRRSTLSAIQTYEAERITVRRSGT
jgi:hypothetical protein